MATRAGACNGWWLQAGKRARVSSACSDRWLAEAKPGDKLAYHWGSVAADKVHDPHLARLADRLLELCSGRFDTSSRCGHIRGQVVGSGQIELPTKREHGEIVVIWPSRNECQHPSAPHDQGPGPWRRRRHPEPRAKVWPPYLEVSKQYLSYARTVLKFTPAAAPIVLSGALSYSRSCEEFGRGGD